MVIVTNITLYLALLVKIPPLSNWSIQASSPKGNSSSPWVSVDAKSWNHG